MAEPGRWPPPGALAPANTRRWALRLPTPMDPASGRCRLAWGRIAAHQANAARRRFEWRVGDGALAWEDPHTLALTLPEPLGVGFRVRVEWSGLVTAAGEPLLDQTWVSPLAWPGPAQGAPGLSVVPAPGSLLPGDARLELCCDRPWAAVEALELLADGEPQPWHLRDNRNPPEWAFIHFERPLPPGSTLRLRARVRDTAGACAALEAAWPVDPRPPPGPVVDPARSEPPPGLASHPADTVAVALRLRAAACLDPSPGAVVLLDPEGAPVPGLVLSCDPTPGHYGAVQLAAGPGFPGLRPGGVYTLRWGGLGLGGVGAPGGWAFQVAAAGQPPEPLLPLASGLALFATPEATYAQPVVMAQGPTAVRGGRVRLLGEGPWEAPFEPPLRQRFAAQLAGPPPQLLRVDPARSALPPGRGDRRFVLEVEDALGRRRAVQALGHDLGQRALTDLRVEAGAVRWVRHAAADTVYAALLRPDGTPVFAGLVAAGGGEGPTAGALALPWALPPGPLVLQAWLLRARPEDDLWDYFVAEVELG